MGKGGSNRQSSSERIAMFQQMGKEQDAYDYIQESEQLPVGIRENAQSKLAGLYGVGPDQIGADSLISQMGFGKYEGYAQNNSAVQELLKGLLAGENRDADIGSLLANAGIADNPQARNVLERLQSGEFDQQGQGAVQQGMIDQARQSPLYGAIMGGQKEGEKSIMRNASMTGDLRSGNVQENLYDYNTQLSNQALLQSYNQQLMGLEGMSQIGPIQSQLAGRLGNTPIPRAQPQQSTQGAWMSGIGKAVGAYAKTKTGGTV